GFTNLRDVERDAAQQLTALPVPKRKFDCRPVLHEPVGRRHGFFTVNAGMVSQHAAVVVVMLVRQLGWMQIAVRLAEEVGLLALKRALDELVDIDVLSVLVLHECGEGSIVHESMESVLTRLELRLDSFAFVDFPLKLLLLLKGCKGLLACLVSRAPFGPHDE